MTKAYYYVIIYYLLLYLYWVIVFCFERLVFFVFKAAIFDLDGTLVDSMSRFTAGLLDILDDNGIEYDLDEMINIITPLGYVGSAKYFISLGAKGTVDELCDRMAKSLVTEYSQNIYLKPSVKGYLEKLQNEGTRLFVLTASPHAVTDPCLKHNGVYDMFEQVWSVEDFSLTKDDLSLFQIVADKIGLATEKIAFFDDNRTAVKNAKKSGYFTVGVKDNQIKEDLKFIKNTADKFIETFGEML